MRQMIRPVDSKSEGFVNNREANSAAIETLRGHLARARAGGGATYVARHRSRGKLLPRERIDLLLDRDSPLLELMALAGVHEEGAVPGAGMVAGIGRVCGVECLVVASEATVQGGAIGPLGVKKSVRLSEVALDNRLPTFHLVESAGADLPNQLEIFVPGGEIFREISRRSRRRVPTISLVFGSCTAGGAYIPGMSDYVVTIKRRSFLYLAGPPLVQMATGEQVDDETLGGAEMHSRRSGVSDYLAEDERDCIRLGREIIGSLGWRKRGPAPSAAPEPPRYDADELLGIASHDVRVPFDVRDVIARIVDGSRFSEFKPLFGPTLVCGFASIGGYRLGLLGNSGVLHADSAQKGAQFIMLCNQSALPLLFLQNTTGFMVGSAAESSGIIRAGAKLINAVANSGVPSITLMIGGSYGAGNYAMMGRAYHPRFIFTWPNHRIAVMGPDQLAGVLDIVKRDAAARRGVEVDEQQLSSLKKGLAGQVERDSTCWAATGRLFDDGVIDPRDTRAVLALALSAVHGAEIEGEASWAPFRH